MARRQTKIEARDSLTANQPDIALHPNNKERRTPSGVRFLHVRPKTRDDGVLVNMSFSRKGNYQKS